MGLVEDPDLDPGIHPIILVPVDLMPHVFPLAMHTQVALFREVMGLLSMGALLEEVHHRK